MNDQGPGKSDFTVDESRSEERFRGFPPKKTTPRDLYEATVTLKPLQSTLFDFQRYDLQSREHRVDWDRCYRNNGFSVERDSSIGP
jgi:hypothetical protein